MATNVQRDSLLPPAISLERISEFLFLKHSPMLLGHFANACQQQSGLWSSSRQRVRFDANAGKDRTPRKRKTRTPKLEPHKYRNSFRRYTKSKHLCGYDFTKHLSHEHEAMDFLIMASSSPSSQMCTFLSIPPGWCQVNQPRPQSSTKQSKQKSD